MKPLKKSLLGLGFLVCALCSYLVGDLLVKRGQGLFIFHPVLALIIALGATGLFYLGLQVKRLKDRRVTWLAPALAPYVALGAQAAAIWSAIFLGFISGEFLVTWQIRTSAVAEEYFWKNLLLFATTLLLAVVALLVENWCQIDLDDSEQSSPSDRGGRVKLSGGPSGAYGRQDWPEHNETRP